MRLSEGAKEPYDSALMKLSIREIKILARYEFRQLLTCRFPQGFVAFLLLATYVGWLLTKLFGNAELINRLADGNLGTDATMVLEFVKWIVGIKEDFLRRIFVEHSAFITILFICTAFLMPFFTMIAALDQNSTDIGSKGIRFLLPRTSRDNLLVGKFLGTFFYWSSAILLIGLAGMTLALMVDQHSDFVRIALDTVWFTVGMILVALPFIAFMTFCSVTTGNPLLAATMGIGIFLGVWIMSGIGGWINEGLKVIGYIFPAPLRYKIMTGDMSSSLLAAMAMVLYSGLYLFVAGIIIQKRDL